VRLPGCFGKPGCFEDPPGFTGVAYHVFLV
jgi:hypothetical protein